MQNEHANQTRRSVLSLTGAVSGGAAILTPNRMAGRAGATDGSYLRNAGIPTYGHSGLAGDINDIRAHGKDERILVQSFYEGEEYLYRLVKLLSGGGP
jgi:acetylornithine deacetylase/succinyl-diaminopimelate desuccinylase-like protein